MTVLTRVPMGMALALGLALAGAAGTPGGAPQASAAPPAGQASCTYTLSAPFLVEVSGRPMVSATLSSLPCTGAMLPNDQTVCVEFKGGISRCNYAPGYATAQVYLVPYRPGATYVSTGKGCAATPPSQVSTCETQGPYSATL